jgi:hypothetical protein
LPLSPRLLLLLLLSLLLLFQRRGCGFEGGAIAVLCAS